tara:strand:- start:1396 stop:1740 length:345 start_codon:yes stop_codon:yes gene_type:complete
MYIVNELWVYIKTFLIHDIKIHGKHLKKDPYIEKYNSILKYMPKPKVPRTGPRIVFSSVHDEVRFIKYLYHLYHNKNSSLTIIEYQMIKPEYDEDYKTNDALIRQEYFYQYSDY